VLFPYLARRGDVQNLGSDGFFRRRPWRRGGGEAERGARVKRRRGELGFAEGELGRLK
jgi:hypothetical protein